MIPAIRFADQGDLEFIMELEKECIWHPWAEDAISRLLDYKGDEQGTFSFAVIAEGSGYVGVSCVLDEAEIGNLAVTAARRREGIGRKLMEFALDELKRKGARKVFLEVEDTNAAAMALYGKLGFTEYNRRGDYYGPGRNALLMSMEIS